jgi:ABC-type lipoprotein export system ATPase subunit
MIQLKNLSYAYNPQKVISFPEFNLNKGEHCLLLGQSGSGKTTLLHLLGGLLRGYSGSIKIDSTELSTLSESDLDRFRGANMGFVFQKNHLLSALTVEKNLLMAPYLSDKKVSAERIDAILNTLGLAEIRNSTVTKISQGQAQRVAIARSVLNSPMVILADEPTSALDDLNCERVITLLLQVAKENHATLIVATHDQRLKNKIEKQIML